MANNNDIEDYLEVAQAQHAMSEESMDKSWKDEFIVAVFMLPIIINFLVPLWDSTFTIAMAWENLAKAPEWYQTVVSILVLVIFGLKAIVYKVADKLFDTGPKSTGGGGGCKCKE
jgi:hypothetical protein